MQVCSVMLQIAATIQHLNDSDILSVGMRILLDDGYSVNSTAESDPKLLCKGRKWLNMKGMGMLDT